MFTRLQKFSVGRKATISSLFLKGTLKGHLRHISTMNSRVQRVAFKMVQKRKAFTLGKRPDDGVELVKGSIWDIIHQRFRELLSQGLVFHLGKLLTLLSCFTTDWIVVRMALITSALLSTSFHFIFPFPRPMRMFYGALFAAGHSYALFRYLLEHSNIWDIKDPSYRGLYDTIFKEAGFTVYHMNMIMEDCDGMDIKVEEGNYIFRQGDEMEYIYIIVSGEVEYMRKFTEDDPFVANAKSQDSLAPLVKGEHVIATIKAGMVVGELYDEEWDPDIVHNWRVSARCNESCRFLRINKRKFHKLVENSPSVRTATLKLLIKDMWRTRRGSAVKYAALQAENEAWKEEVHKLRAENEILRHRRMSL